MKVGESSRWEVERVRNGIDNDMRLIVDSDLLYDIWDKTNHKLYATLQIYEEEYVWKPKESYV